MTMYSQNLGGKFTGPHGIIQQTLVLADFTDGGGADGTADLDDALPLGAAVVSVGIEVVEGFTGTGAVTAALTQDAVAVGQGGLVVTVGGETYVGEGVDGSNYDIRLSDEDGVLTITVSDTTDFGVIVTGATGEINVRIIYAQIVSVDGR